LCEKRILASSCLSVCLSVCMSACLPACLPACLSVCLPVSLSVCLPACLPACLSACLPVCLSACLPVCLPACLSVCMSACLPVCLSVCMSACLPACLPVCLSVCLPVCLPACLPVCLPVCLPACLPVCLPACLSACLRACLPVCLPASLSVCLPVCQSAWLAAKNNSSPTGRIFMKFYISGFFEDVSRELNLKPSTSKQCSTCRPVYIYKNISVRSSYNEKCFCQTLYRKSKHITCSIYIFFRKSCRLWDNVEKYGRVRQATDDNITRLMRFACRIRGKNRETLSEYATFIAFPRHTVEERKF
jgi:hypothetical protein